jgi:hypothetical protein
MSDFEVIAKNQSLQSNYSIDKIDFNLMASPLEVEGRKIERLSRSAVLPQKIDLVGQPVKTEARNGVRDQDRAEVVRRILRALTDLEYGSVEIIVQDSKVVQIERTQRSRFAQPLEIPTAEG